MEIIPTSKTVELIDVEYQKPPKADKLILLSKYHILSIGTFVEGFHIAWSPLPKIPQSIKDKRGKRYDSEFDTNG